MLFNVSEFELKSLNLFSWTSIGYNIHFRKYASVNLKLFDVHTHGSMLSHYFIYFCIFCDIRLIYY